MVEISLQFYWNVFPRVQLINQHWFEVMAWCRQATSHYLNQRWPRFILPYGIGGTSWGMLMKLFLQIYECLIWPILYWLSYWRSKCEISFWVMEIWIKFAVKFTVVIKRIYWIGGVSTLMGDESVNGTHRLNTLIVGEAMIHEGSYCQWLWSWHLTVRESGNEVM